MKTKLHGKKQIRNFQKEIQGKRGITIKVNYATTILVTWIGFQYYVATLSFDGKKMKRIYHIADSVEDIQDIIADNNSLLTEEQITMITGLLSNN